MNKRLAVFIALLAPMGAIQAGENQPSYSLELGELETRRENGEGIWAWDLTAAVDMGRNGFQLRSEGERADNSMALNEMRLQYHRELSENWSAKLGVRRDTGQQPTREWLELGMEGEIPLGIETSTAFYFGKSSRRALRFEAERPFELAPRWSIVPETTINAYDHDDPALGIGSGLADIELAARLNYEVTPHFSLHAGGLWVRVFGDTADLADAAGEDRESTQFVVGFSAAF